MKHLYRISTITSLVMLLAVFWLINPITSGNVAPAVFGDSTHGEASAPTLTPTTGSVEQCSACEVFDMQNLSVTLTAIGENIALTPSPVTANKTGLQRGSIFYIVGFLILISFLLLLYRLWKSGRSEQ